MTPPQFRAHLAALRLSLNEAARRLDIHPRTVRKYASGDLVITRLVELALVGLKHQPPIPLTKEPSHGL